ncbi:Protein Y32F6A.4 [Aphelenchoides avenae]|nr:Protein Y32F6A.4 [Aphelenchus avenae]
MSSLGFSKSKKYSITPASSLSTDVYVTPVDTKKDLSSSESDSVEEQHGDGYFVDGKFERHTGLNWFITGLFIVGDLAGGGIVALPTATIQTGFWIGIVINILMVIIVCYTAYALGQCWVIMQRRWPEYRSHCRKPYAELGYRALGPTMRAFISGCIYVTQFSIAVVLMLLASNNIHDFLKSLFGVEINFCLVILVVAVGLLPVTFLKSPEEFWGAVVMAMVSTSAAVVLICVGAGLDYHVCAPEKAMPEFQITNYFLALGTFLFAYGGHSAFPTIQHDMKKPHEFTKSSILAFAIICTLYMPVCIVGYLVYGNSLRASVITNVQTEWIQQAVNLMIAAHCILSLTIVFNPLNQEVEDRLGVPHQFGIKRVIVRTAVLASVVFVAESVPNFGPVLDLVGGSTLTLTSLVFPCIFYVYISAGEKRAEDGDPKSAEDYDRPPTNAEVLRYTDKRTLFICIFVILFGIIGGGAATFSAIRELSTTQFKQPCYVAAFTGNFGTDNGLGHLNCCGPCMNIAVNGNASYCSKPEIKYYGYDQCSLKS